jgi:hypothetical protein
MALNSNILMETVRPLKDSSAIINNLNSLDVIHVMQTKEVAVRDEPSDSLDSNLVDGISVIQTKETYVTVEPTNALDIVTVSDETSDSLDSNSVEGISVIQTKKTTVTVEPTNALDIVTVSDEPSNSSDSTDQHHASNSAKTSVVFKCGLCYRRFKHSDSLKSHMIKHLELLTVRFARKHFCANNVLECTSECIVNLNDMFALYVAKHLRNWSYPLHSYW